MTDHVHQWTMWFFDCTTSNGHQYTRYCAKCDHKETKVEALPPAGGPR